MGLSGSVDQMRESFEAQFEAAGEGRYLYRRSQKGEPIPITAEERDRFVRQYVRRVWFILVGMMAALAVFWGAVIWWAVARNREFPDIATYVSTAAVAVAAIVLMYWVRGAPARELEGRASVGRERTSEEMRVLYLRKTSYGQLATAAGFGIILPFMQTFGRHPVDIFHGWGRVCLVLGAALVLFAGIQAFRKWRFDKQLPSDVI